MGCDILEVMGGDKRMSWVVRSVCHDRPPTHPLYKYFQTGYVGRSYMRKGFGTDRRFCLLPKSFFQIYSPFYPP